MPKMVPPHENDSDIELDTTGEFVSTQFIDSMQKNYSILFSTFPNGQGQTKGCPLSKVIYIIVTVLYRLHRDIHFIKCRYASCKLDQVPSQFYNSRHISWHNSQHDAHSTGKFTRQTVETNNQKRLFHTLKQLDQTPSSGFTQVSLDHWFTPSLVAQSLPMSVLHQAPFQELRITSVF